MRGSFGERRRGGERTGRNVIVCNYHSNYRGSYDREIMRLRPANIRVINRRKNYLDHDSRCLLRARKKKKTVARS
jgi:hypothetical protein